MKFLVFFFILINFTVCAQDDKVKVKKEDYTIQYPSEFNFDDSGKEGTEFILIAPADGEKDTFIENINLATQKVGSIVFEDYARKTVEEIKVIANIIENKRLNINGGDCLRIIMETTHNNIDLTFIQHYYIKNQKVYVLTFSSETKVYDDYYDKMNDVLMSFMIK